MNEPNLIKKISITDNAILKQKRILIIAILCVITLFISSSYALLTNFDKTDNVINFQTGNLNMTVTTSNNQLILTELNGKLPESDAVGLQNATPIQLTLTNTGSMFIDGYEVKLVSETGTTNKSTLEDKYIKYAISEDGTTYSTPKLLTEHDNTIFVGYDLDLNASKTIYLKIWIDENAGNNALNKEYYGAIDVELYQYTEEIEFLNDVFKEVLLTRTNSYILEDETYYVSGPKDDGNAATTDDIDFNYVWYSGKLWRITAIYPDGTMKMITDGLITSINWGATSTVSDTDLTSAYSTSYMREWLNQEFLPTLNNYEDIIVENAGWYSITDSADPPTKPTGDYTLTDPVGLLNAYEYYMSYQNAGDYSNGYLNIGYYWWLITPYSSSNVRGVNSSGALDNRDPSSYSFGGRPVINLQSTIQLSGGTGTVSDPYRIKGDQEEITPNTTLISTRQSGEYLKLSSEETAPMFRIVDKEKINGTTSTKIVLNDYVRDVNDVDADSNITEALMLNFSSSDEHELWTEVDKTNENYWRGYLNKTWLSEIDETYNAETGVSGILEKGTYYLGYHTTGSYKTTVCSSVSSDVSIKQCIENGTVVTNTSSDDYVGLLRVGEMFASQFGTGYNNSSNMWLITPYGSSYVRYVGSHGSLSYSLPSSYSRGGRPSINLKSTIVIKSGSGTKQDPFVVGLST